MDVKLSVLESLCILCSAKTEGRWCAECEEDMLSNIPRCPICARSGFYRKACGVCLKKTPNYHSTEVLFQYRYPVNHLIKALKFNDRPEFSIAFAELMAKKLKREKKRLPEKLIPVPLHKKRQRQRGYNQSLTFSREITKQIGIQTENCLCQRIKHTEAQSSLPFSLRRRNISNVFVLTSGCVPKHIAIIDDVVTSGSTVNELASLFKKAGCKTIEVWAIART